MDVDPEWLQAARKNGLILSEKKVGQLGNSPTDAPAVEDEPRKDDVAPLLAAVAQAGYGDPVMEHKFHPVRRWRFDYAWIDMKVALEREGGTFAPEKCKRCGHTTRRFMSRHHSKEGMENDAEKYNAACAMSWFVIRATPRMLKDGRALAALLATLEARTKLIRSGEHSERISGDSPVLVPGRADRAAKRVRRGKAVREVPDVQGSN